MVRLEPMTAGELRGFLDESIPRYAEAHVRGGRWKPEEAVERSRAEHEQLLPHGVETSDNYLRTVRDERTGARVGEVWYAFQKQEGWPQVFVYWIGILPEHRRKGYASAVFRLVESEAKRLGAARVALHVFADNEGATAMYRGLGYAPVNVIMAKTLA